MRVRMRCFKGECLTDSGKPSSNTISQGHGWVVTPPYHAVIPCLSVSLQLAAPDLLRRAEI